MGMGEFLHKGLIQAGSKDAVSNMMIGAGVGAVANIGLGVTNGDFSVIGNGTSGAMLGAIGGAGARHMGSKYVDGLRMAEKEGQYSNKFGTTMFTKADKMAEGERQDFWGSNENFGKFNHEVYDKAGTDNANRFNPPKPEGVKSNGSEPRKTTSSEASNASGASVGGATQEAGENLSGKGKGLAGRAMDSIKNFVKDGVREERDIWNAKNMPNTSPLGVENMSRRFSNESSKNRVNMLQQRVDNKAKVSELAADTRNSPQVKEAMEMGAERLNVARNGTGSEKQATFKSSSYLDGRRSETPKLDAKRASRETAENNHFVSQQTPSAFNSGTIDVGVKDNNRKLSTGVKLPSDFKKNSLAQSIQNNN